MQDARDLFKSLRDWNAGPEQTGPVEREIERLNGDNGGDCEVHEDNWDSVLLFCALDTQWRTVATMAGAFCVGLEYAGVKALLDLTGLKARDRTRRFADVQVMESAALRCWSEQRAAQTSTPAAVATATAVR